MRHVRINSILIAFLIFLWLISGPVWSSVTYSPPPPTREQTRPQKEKTDQTDTIDVVLYGQMEQKDKQWFFSVDSGLNLTDNNTLQLKPDTKFMPVKDKQSQDLFKKKEYREQPMEIVGKLNQKTSQVWITEFKLVEQKK